MSTRSVTSSRHPRALSRIVTTGTLAAIVGVLAACTSAPAQVAPYAAEIEQARAHATSDFERDALSDGDVGATEYEQAVALYVECLRGKGWQIEAVRNGAIFTYAVAGDASGTLWDENELGCRDGTIALIEPLYVGMVSNPLNEDMLSLIAECLLELGVVPESTGAERTRDLVTDPDSAPWMDDDERVVRCMTDPASVVRP